MTVAIDRPRPQVFHRLGQVGVAVGMAVAVSWPISLPLLGVSERVAVVLALGAMPLLLVASLWFVQPALTSVRVIALVGVLAALGAVARLTSVGLGGLEWVFIVAILSGRALGARAGFVVGALSIAVSSLVWGGVGPWTAFQMAGVGAVAAGAGLLPHTRTDTGRFQVSRTDIATLAVYGVIASYLFGAVMNLWFWPLAVGPDTAISFEAGAGLWENVSRFFVFSLTTSTLTWDSVRALVTAIGVVVLARPFLNAVGRVYRRRNYTE